MNTTGPEAIEPEASDPQASAPGTSGPSASGPSASAPEATEPKASAPEAREPAATEPAATKPVRRHRVRRTISWILVVLAALLVGLGSVAVWASRTIVNEDRFTTVVSDVVSDQAVLSAASKYITDQVQVAVDSSGVLDNLPSQLQTIVNALRGAIHSRVEERVNDVLSSDAGQKALIGAVTVAHRQAMKILQGGGLLNSDAIKIENGTVTLNLIPLARQVLIRLQQDGLIPSSITIPTNTDEPGPIQQALGNRLPPDFGQIVVYRTDAASGDQLLDQAQRALVLAKRGVVLLVILALVCCVAAVLVAVDRRRAVFRVGIGITIACVLLIVVTRRVTAALPDATQTPGGGAIARALGASLRSSLVRALVIVGLLAAVIGVVTRFADSLAAWARRQKDLATIAVVAVGLVLLLVLGISWGSVIFAVVVTALGILAVRLWLPSHAGPTTPGAEQT